MSLRALAIAGLVIIILGLWGRIQTLEVENKHLREIQFYQETLLHLERTLQQVDQVLQEAREQKPVYNKLRQGGESK